MAWGEGLTARPWLKTRMPYPSLLTVRSNMGRGGSGGASCLCGSAKCYAAALSKPILRLFCGWLLVPVLFLVHHHNALCVNCRNCGATHAVSTCSTLHTTTVYYSTYVKQDVHCQ